MKRELNSDLSGNEVYYTACYLLVIFKHSCSKLHCQKGLNLILVSYKTALDAKQRTYLTHSSGVEHAPCEDRVLDEHASGEKGAKGGPYQYGNPRT